MITNTRITNPISQLQLEADVGSLRRLLVAAAISPAYCRRLLDSPAQAIREGFGGEAFPLTESTLETISAIRAASVADFIHSINEKIPIL